ncbi:PTS sugar transporter subunit IIB [Pediococcus parvulus]|uniref:PTS sugar transporter subunit IIB n=1 Tax=Pediococcus parvulus TaxID=54062 RepID=UPI00345E996A
MKKMLIMCGAGHATSTVVRSKVEEWLSDNEFSETIKIKQSAVGDEIENIAGGAYDIVVSTTIVPESIKNKVINGVSLLTGIGADKVYQEIKKQIER